MKVESLGLRDSSEVERIEVLDTLKEVTTITVQVNEAGDTLRQSIVTDRLRSRDRSQLRDQRVETKVIRDTVYIERRDSVLVQQETLRQAQGDKTSPVVSALKWVFWILVAVGCLIIIIRLKR